jgi:hypothetical protein
MTAKPAARVGPDGGDSFAGTNFKTMEENDVMPVLAAEAMAQKPEYISVPCEVEGRSWRTLYRRRVYTRVRNFHLYRPTAAKVALTSALFLKLEINAGRMKKNPIVEAMRVSAKHTQTVAKIIALHTTMNWDEVYSEEWVSTRAELLARIFNMQTMATLLEWTILAGDYLPFANALGSTLQANDIVLKAKKSQHTEP